MEIEPYKPKARRVNTQDGSRLRGLTADDRDDDDKNYLDTLKGIPPTTKKPPVGSMLIRAPKAAVVEEPRANELRNLLTANGTFKYNEDSDVFKYVKAKNRYESQYGVGQNIVNSQANTNIKDVASKISPYYQKYNGTDKLRFTDYDWTRLAADYRAQEEIYGSDAAARWLNSQIQDEVASNQSVLEKAWNALAGMGADATGSLISTAGMFYGAATAASGNYDKVEGLNGWQNFWNRVLDNEITRYGNDIVEYGTILHLDDARKTGLSETPILNTTEQEQAFLSWNTPFEAVQQGGFTLASMLTGAAASKVANFGFKSLKRGLLYTTEDLSKARKLLTGVQKAQNINNKYVIPAVVGTTEGVVEGLQTKIGVQEKGYQEILNAQQEAFNNRMQEVLSQYTQYVDRTTEMPTMRYLDQNGNEVNVEDVRKQVWSELAPKFEESLHQVDYAASRAGIGNFFVNSAINGAINSTLKAGIHSEPVQNTLKNSKLFGWAKAKPKFKIDGTPGNATVTSTLTKKGKLWEITKEPLGEFTEEYLQTISDSFFEGFGDHNIHSFVDNKYNGDMLAKVGDTFSGDWGAAWTELERNLTSKESMKAGVMGALSSALGTLKVNGYRNANGKVFSRETREDGSKESVLGLVSRVTPWRSPVLSNIRQAKKDLSASQEQAKALQEWLNDPNNLGKLTGLNGSYSWAEELGGSSAMTDEYNYRNSMLGKAINDIFMLQKAEGSEAYNSIVNQMTEMAYMKRDSKEAEQYIKSVRDNVNENKDRTDDEIFNDLQSHAKENLELMSKVKEESDKVTKLVGDIDEDTKQSLVFAQISMENWDKRYQQLSDEVNKIHPENSTEQHSTLTDAQKKATVRYGGVAQALKMRDKLRTDIAGLEEDIKGLEKRRKTLTKPEELKLKALKVNLKSLKAQQKNLKDIAELPEGANAVLSEEEIMALDPITRAQMILKGKEKLYRTLYYHDSNTNEDVADNKETRPYFSEEQQAVIDHLVEQGMAKDRDFLAKVVDMGRIRAASDRFHKQYNDVLTDQRGFNSYVAMAKQQAADAVTRERAASINKLENYTEFANALDEALEQSDVRSARVLLRSLKNNPNYTKYQQNKDFINRLVTTLASSEKFKNIDGNSADLLVDAINYCSNKGVEISDADQVWNALTEMDDKGYNKFANYVSDLNSEADETNKTRFTSIEEVFQNFRDVSEQVKKDLEAQKAAAKPVVANPSTKQTNPPVNPAPTVKQEKQEEKKPQSKQGGNILADLMGNSANDGQIDPNTGEVIKGPKVTQPEGNNPQGNPSSPENNNNEEDNTPSSNSPLLDESSDDVKEAFLTSQKNIELGSNLDTSDPKVQSAQKLAKDALDEVAQNKYDDIDDYAAAVYQKALEVVKGSTGNDDKRLAKDLLMQAVNRANELSKEARAGNKSSLTKQPVNTESAVMESMDIDYVRQKFPNSAIIKYYDAYGIDQFLADHELTGSTSVYFLVDQKLVNDVKTDMGDKYTDADFPIVAVIEAENGPYTIDGKHYQPICIMPKTSNQHFNGSKYTGNLRALVPGSNVENYGLIKWSDGTVIQTTPNGKGGGVVANPADKNTRENNSIGTLLERMMTPEEKDEYDKLNKKDRRNSRGYLSAKKHFISRLFKTVLNNGKVIAYQQSNKKDDKGRPIYVWDKEINKTTGRNTDRTFNELVEDPNTGIQDLIRFNSRTKRYADTLISFLENLPNSATATPSDIDAVVNAATELGKKLSKFIYFGNTDYRYVIKDLAALDENNEHLFEISLQNDSEKDTIVLAQFSKGSDPERIAAEMLRTLLNPETVEKISAKWQLDYDEVAKAQNGDKGALNNISDWVDDDILELAASQLTYNIRGIRLNSPFKKDGSPRAGGPVIANKDNADLGNPINQSTVAVGQTQTPQGKIVDEDSGAPLGGNNNGSQENDKLKFAEEKVEQITENSKHLHLSEDGKTYVDDRTGQVYSRVTSVISADERGPERFDSSSPWVLPSTNIGTTVDEFVRDFFAGTMKDSYPNASPEQWDIFKTQLEGLRLFMIAKGLHVVPRDVTVTGSFDVTDADKKVHTINVAGTLDLLAYDNDGNFYIFDMKTMHSDKTKDEAYLNKWALQTSMYQIFLQNAFGINVKSRQIIPIVVKYPSPTRDADYTQGEGTEILINGEPYKQASPDLKPEVAVPYIEPKIVYNKLTEEERELADQLKEQTEAQMVDEGNNGPIETAQPAEPVKAVVSEVTDVIEDANTNLAREKDFMGDQLPDSLRNLLNNGKSLDAVGENPKSSGIDWDNLTDEQLDRLAKYGVYSEADFVNLPDEERKHAKECMGL